MKVLSSNSLDGLFWANDSLPTLNFGSFVVAIETPKYGMRQGPGWISTPPADYGYIVNTTGADGDEMDCYLGPNPESNMVYVVDQNQIGKSEFDEHKCMLGYDSMQAAKDDYIIGHTHGAQIFRNVTPMSIKAFKEWLDKGDISKPLGG